MKKLTIAIIAAVIVVAGGAGAYFVLKSDNSQTTSTTQSEDASGFDITDAMAQVESHFGTVTETRVYTEETDQNNLLGKPGQYIAAASFWDTRTGFTDDEDEPGMWGTDAGGSIEVFANADDAKARIELMEPFQGNPLTDPGAFRQVDNVVVRASYELTASQQNEILDYLESIVK